MSIGNILAVIESKFGLITADEFTQRYNAGDDELDRLLPDGDWWFLDVDIDAAITSIETIPRTEIQSFIGQETKRSGGLAIRTRHPGRTEVQARFFPDCRASEVMNEKT